MDFQIPCVGTNLLAMIHDLRPDLVSVAVPYHFHHEIVTEIAASDAPPRQIFCEKPMADTVAHAEAMLSACRNTSIALYINNRRLVPIYEKMRTIVREEFSGEIVTFSATSSSCRHYSYAGSHPVYLW